VIGKARVTPMKAIATSPCPSEARSAAALRLALIGDPGSDAVLVFQRALREAGCAQAHVVDYREALRDPGEALGRVPAGSLLRLDSPGRAEDLRRALIARGVERGSGDPLAQGLHPEGARMVQPPAWARGFADLLRQLEAAAAERGLRWVQAPRSVIACFDKLCCERVLARARVALSRSLGRIASFDQLRARMAQAGLARVFIKPRFGSSASGCIALASSVGRGGRRYRAHTTVELATRDGRVYPYNTRTIRVIDGEAEVARLIAALAGHALIAQEWVPKAGFAGQSADLRVLWLDGALAHGVLRTGRGPMTNLHLGGQRHGLQALRARVEAGVWQRLEQDCARVAGALPGMLHLGIDVALLAGLRAHRVLEVNAFGDRLHGVLQEGCTPQALQVRALRRRWEGEIATC
jgi:glutathione synthase/RimK-type ligase-like ATP-grasp enzyme